MRSRTSRGVLEWSGGEDLYIGSQVLAIRKVSGVTGIVPGPPEGSRGSTGWGHPSRRAPWAEVGREPAHSGLVRPLLGPPMRLGLGTLGEGAPPLALGGTPPLGRPPLEIPSLGPAPPWGPYIKRGGGRAAAPNTLAPPSPPCYTSSSRSCLAKPCRSPAASTTTPSCCWIFINLSFPLTGSRRRRRHLLSMCVECGGAVRSALGHR